MITYHKVIQREGSYSTLSAPYPHSRIGQTSRIRQQRASSRETDYAGKTAVAKGSLPITKSKQNKGAMANKSQDIEAKI